RAEREVDMRLRALARRVLRRPALIASLSPKGGTGKTTLAVLVAQLVSTRLRWPVLVLDTDFTGGTAREHIPSDGQTSATRVDAVQARWTLGHLALQYPDVPLTVVVNQMPHRLDEGARCAQQVRVADRTVGRVELPYDDALKRQLDAGVLDVDRVEQRTRIA